MQGRETILVGTVLCAAAAGGLWVGSALLAEPAAANPNFWPTRNLPRETIVLRDALASAPQLRPRLESLIVASAGPTPFPEPIRPGTISPFASVPRPLEPGVLEGEGERIAARVRDSLGMASQALRRALQPRKAESPSGGSSAFLVAAAGLNRGPAFYGLPALVQGTQHAATQAKNAAVRMFHSAFHAPSSRPGKAGTPGTFSQAPAADTLSAPVAGSLKPGGEPLGAGPGPKQPEFVREARYEQAPLSPTPRPGSGVEAGAGKGSSSAPGGNSLSPAVLQSLAGAGAAMRPAVAKGRDLLVKALTKANNHARSAANGVGDALAAIITLDGEVGKRTDPTSQELHVRLSELRDTVKDRLSPAVNGAGLALGQCILEKSAKVAACAENLDIQALGEHRGLVSNLLGKISATNADVKRILDALQADPAYERLSAARKEIQSQLEKTQGALNRWLGVWGEISGAADDSAEIASAMSAARDEIIVAPSGWLGTLELFTELGQAEAYWRKASLREKSSSGLEAAISGQVLGEHALRIADKALGNLAKAF